MVKHPQTIPGRQPLNYLSVLDHFVGLALKRLNKYHDVVSAKNGNIKEDQKKTLAFL